MCIFQTAGRKRENGIEVYYMTEEEKWMFGLGKKERATKVLDDIIAEIMMNMQNNYKDAAQLALKELEEKFCELEENGKLNEKQKTQYRVKLHSFQEQLKLYSHKDQKPYWTKD